MGSELLLVIVVVAALYVVVQRTPVRANDLDRSRAAVADARQRVPVPA